MSKLKVRDSKKRIAFPILIGSSFSEHVSEEGLIELHVVPVGKWDHPAYGEMEFTSNDIAEFVANFRAGIRKDIPITAGHDSMRETPAIGWFKELYDRGVNGLWALVEFTEEGKRLLRTKAFKYFSPEIMRVYEDPATGERYENVLIGGALTNSPFFRELEAPVAAFSEHSIMNQFNDNSMNLEEILAKNADQLTEDEAAFLRENSEDLTAEQRSAFESVLEDGGEGDEGGSEGGDEGGNGAGEGNDDGGDGAEGQGEEGAAPVAASDKGKKGVVMMSETEVAALRARADQGHQAFTELQKMKIAAQVDALTFSESNRTGRLLPKQKDATVKFLFSLKQSQRDQFVNIIKALPEVKSFSSEIGDGGDVAGTTALRKFEEKVQEVMKANDGMKYSDAVNKVAAQHPEIYQEYENSLGEA